MQLAQHTRLFPRLRTRLLQVPEHTRVPFECKADMPLHEAFLEKCNREAALLEGWAEGLKPLAGTVNSDGMGLVIAALKAEAAKRPAAADPDGGGGSAQRDTRAEEAEALAVAIAVARANAAAERKVRVAT